VLLVTFQAEAANFLIKLAEVIGVVSPFGNTFSQGGTLATLDTSAMQLSTRLHLYSTLTEKAVYFNHESDRPLAEMLFNLKAGSD